MGTLVGISATLNFAVQPNRIGPIGKATKQNKMLTPRRPVDFNRAYN